MNVTDIKDKLKIYYESKSSSSKRTFMSYLAELEKSAYINIDLKVPPEVDGPCQVLEPFKDGYLLRIFHVLTWWKDNQSYTGFIEEFRAYFSKNYGNVQLFIHREYGRSGVYGYHIPRQMMGYHQADLADNTPLKFINKTDFFPYIDFSNIKIIGMRFMDEFYAADQKQFHTKTSRVNAVDREYTLELLIKQNKLRLAEIYVNECWNADMKMILRYNSKLLQRPTASRVRLASALETYKYQTGMIQFSDDIYHRAGDEILEVLKLCSWDKFYTYIKKQYAFNPNTKKRNYLIDFLDYRQYNKEFGLPDFPKNLYTAKELVREQQDAQRAIRDKKKYKKFTNKIVERTKSLFSVENDKYVIFPAASSDAILDEGKRMHHCVASYTEDYANGKKDLYFLRSKNNIDVPLVTIEITNGKLHQARAKHNQKPPKDTMAVINKLVNKYKNKEANYGI